MRAWTILAVGACVVAGGCIRGPSVVEVPDPSALVIFHNNTGPMCFACLDWIADAKTRYPDLVVKEYLVYEPVGSLMLAQLMQQSPTSEGVSTSFGYLPFVFFQGRAFSGFNDEIAQALEELLAAAEAGP
jgi:hypothetical protein